MSKYAKKPKYNAGMKVKALDDLITHRNSQSAKQNEVLSQVAANLVAPGLAEPVIFPGLGRRGAARYRVVRTVTTGTSFAVRARPVLIDPVCITSSTIQPFGSHAIPGKGVIKVDGTYVELKSHECDSYLVLARKNGASGVQTPTLPLEVSANSTLNWQFQASNSVPAVLGLEAWTGAAWVTPALWANVTVGKTYGAVTALATWITSYKEYRFTLTSLHGDTDYSADLSYEVSGSSVSCAPVLEDCVMEAENPEWEAIKSVSSEINVVAMEMLVTYKGSSLNNTGSIAAAYVEDEDLEFDSNFYETLADRPYDRHEGRLAPAGGEEGGAHLHYVPTDFSLLITGDDDLKDFPSMYAAVTGKTSGEAVRVEVNMIVNFYTTDSSYNMVHTPPVDGLMSMFSYLRMAVPIVSSNDSHLKKLQKVLRKGKKYYDLSKNGYNSLNDQYGKEIALLSQILKSLM